MQDLPSESYFHFKEGLPSRYVKDKEFELVPFVGALYHLDIYKVGKVIVDNLNPSKVSVIGLRVPRP